MTKRQYFGTDGIRGEANSFPMTAPMAQKVAMAAAKVLKTHDTHSRVVIGKDTRLSCYMIEQAMASGFLAMGMEVLFFGPMPTPGVAMLTKAMRADLGVMISASHNEYKDNGIKLFGSDGYKLSDERELEIEALIDKKFTEEMVPAEKVGRAMRLEDAPGRYIEYVKNTFPSGLTLDGLKIVIDCANGAAYRVAPEVLWELGAEVVPIAVTPNGKNINLGCGATDTALLQRAVIDHEADIGIALDGDADRLIVVDETGARVDGDQLMAVIVSHWNKKGWLKAPKLAATVMSNLGMERYLAEHGIELLRSKVGDRYVMRMMQESGAQIGGEQSGHIIFGDVATSGDGLLSALQVLAVLTEESGKASEVLNVFTPVPQILKNLKYDRKAGSPLDKPEVQDILKEAEKNIQAAGGRLVVRASGTEPKIRVMAEGDDAQKVEDQVDDIIKKISTYANSQRSVA